MTKDFYDLKWSKKDIDFSVKNGDPGIKAEQFVKTRSTGWI